jgi:phosphoglycolate phosphatase
VNKRLLIFDLDGTLLDTIDDLHNSLMDTVDKFGFPRFEIDITKTYVGDGIKKLVERGVGKENFLPEHEAFFRATYKNRMVENTKPFDGITEMLEILFNQGHIIAVLSNKSTDMTDYLVKFYGIDKWARFWFGGDSFEEKKPSPLPVIKIMDIIGIDKKNTIMIGDNYTDIECGHNAGVTTIFCTFGYGKLSGVLPDFFAETPGEIINIIGSLP